MNENDQPTTNIQDVKSKTYAWIILIVVVIIILGSIGLVYYLKNKTKTSSTTGTNPSDHNITDVGNQFALDYYARLRAKNDDNIFFSPFSISSAFAMTYEGARGQTAEEMRAVFHFPEDDTSRRAGYASVFNEINKTEKKYQLRSANALWAQQDYQFSKNFFDNVENYYGGKVTNLDFIKNPETSRATINQWVEKQTEDKIKNLIPAGTIQPTTKLVLTNAIYFKGEWVKQFNKDNTQEEDFRTSSGKTVNAKMMQRTDKDATFNYGENDDLQILEMPYAGDDLSILILLPKNDNLTKLENMLTTNNLSIWGQSLTEQRVNIYIPKFKFETKYFMANELKAMGMPLAFSGSADFSGMTASGEKDLEIDEAIHQAFVEINEEGTEAAAATEVTMELKSAAGNAKPKTPVFKANHPFVFLIQEKSGGNILFMGRVTNPNA